MIHNAEQLEATRMQYAKMLEIMALYREQIAGKNPQNYTLYAEGCRDMMLSLRKEIDDYLGTFTFWEGIHPEHPSQELNDAKVELPAANGQAPQTIAR